jgi:flagellin-like protein
MKQFAQNEEAVSPVIGVILMVAITVILAAVIAAFVFGMAGNMSSTKSVAATAAHSVDVDNKQAITVTFQGGKDAGIVQNIAVVINDKSEMAENLTSDKPLTGNSKKFTDGTNFTITAGNRNHVVATASFTDGSSQVILDTYV